MKQSKPAVLMCGNVFDGVSEDLSGSGEFLVQGRRACRRCQGLQAEGSLQGAEPRARLPHRRGEA